MVFSAREQGKGQFSSLAAVLIVTAILLWPAYVNGEPFYMPDTSSYLRGADAAIHRLTGESSVWTQEYLRRYPSGPGKSEVAASAAPVVLAGRSIYYGSALYAAQWFGNFWAVAVLQAKASR